MLGAEGGGGADPTHRERRERDEWGTEYGLESRRARAEARALSPFYLALVARVSGTSGQPLIAIRASQLPAMAPSMMSHSARALREVFLVLRSFKSSILTRPAKR